MTLPKIAADDAVLFGSLAIFAVGVLLAVLGTSGNVLLSIGAALITFGLPSALIIFMAAAEEPK